MKPGLNEIMSNDVKGMEGLWCASNAANSISISNKEDVQEEITPFGRDDLEDIISDLQDEYYRLAISKDILLKIKIADLIDRLLRLKETMVE